MAENIPNPIPTDLEERFWARVDVRGQDECWVWTGHTPRRGYGILHIAKTRRNLRAHRLSYVIHNGPIPDGMLICHKCDNPSCVNPSHLFAGTALDNNRDRDRKGRGKYHFQNRPEIAAQNDLQTVLNEWFERQRGILPMPTAFCIHTGGEWIDQTEPVEEPKP